jgi:hypothetical protein
VTKIVLLRPFFHDSLHEDILALSSPEFAEALRGLGESEMLELVSGLTTQKRISAARIVTEVRDHFGEKIDLDFRFEDLEAHVPVEEDATAILVPVIIECIGTYNPNFQSSSLSFSGSSFQTAGLLEFAGDGNRWSSVLKIRPDLSFQATGRMKTDLLVDLGFQTRMLHLAIFAERIATTNRIGPMAHIVSLQDFETLHQANPEGSRTLFENGGEFRKWMRSVDLSSAVYDVCHAMPYPESIERFFQLSKRGQTVQAEHPQVNRTDIRGGSQTRSRKSGRSESITKLRLFEKATLPLDLRNQEKRLISSRKLIVKQVGESLVVSLRYGFSRSVTDIRYFGKSKLSRHVFEGVNLKNETAEENAQRASTTPPGAVSDISIQLATATAHLKNRPYDFRSHYGYGSLLLDIFLFGKTFDTFIRHSGHSLLRRAMHHLDQSLRMVPSDHFLKPRMVRTALLVYALCCEGRLRNYELALLRLRLNWHITLQNPCSSILLDFREHLLAADRRGFHRFGFYDVKASSSEFPSLVFLAEHARRHKFSFKILLHHKGGGAVMSTADSNPWTAAAKHHGGWNALWLLYSSLLNHDFPQLEPALVSGMQSSCIRIPERFGVSTPWTSAIDVGSMVLRIVEKDIFRHADRISLLKNALSGRVRQPLDTSRALRFLLADPESDDIDLQTGMLEELEFLPDSFSVGAYLSTPTLRSRHRRMENFITLLATADKSFLPPSSPAIVPWIDKSMGDDAFLKAFLTCPVYSETLIEDALRRLSRLKDGEKDLCALVWIRMSRIRTVQVRDIESSARMPDVQPIQFTFPALLHVNGSDSIYFRGKTNLMYLPMHPRAVILSALPSVYSADTLSLGVPRILASRKVEMTVPYRRILELAESNLLTCMEPSTAGHGYERDPILGYMLIAAILEPILDPTEKNFEPLSQEQAALLMTLIRIGQSLLQPRILDNLLKHPRVTGKRKGSDQTLSDYLALSSDQLGIDFDFMQFVDRMNTEGKYSAELAQLCAECLLHTHLNASFGNYLEKNHMKLEGSLKENALLQDTLDAVGTDIRLRLERQTRSARFGTRFASTISYWYKKDAALTDTIRKSLFKMIHQSDYFIDNSLLGILMDLYQKDRSRSNLLLAIDTHAKHFGVRLPAEWKEKVKSLEEEVFTTIENTY